MSTISGDIPQIQGLAASIHGLSTEQAILAMTTAKVSPQLMTEALMANGVEKEAAEAAVAHAGLSVSQGAATKSTLSLSAAFQGLKASIGTVGLVIGGVVVALAAVATAITIYNKAKEDVRKTSVSSTNAYVKENKSLNSQIEKYKELKESLDSGNLSTSESLAVKEQLLDIQQSLIDSYGDEASNLDLVNGKYADQLGLLSELSKEKATQYVNENREAYADAKAALEKQRTYSLGYVMQWNGAINDKNQLLYDFLDNYSDFFDLGKHTVTGGGVTSSVVSLDVKADVETAQDLLHQFAIDLEQFGNKNNINVSGILESVSGQLSGIWTEELDEYKQIYNEFINAEIMRNDSLRPLYKNSIAAVEEYNKALSSGEGVTEALIKVNNLKATVEAATQGNIEYREAWEAIWDAINSKNEEKYNLKTRLSNDGGLMQYIYQLKDLYAVDLRGMNFTDGVTAQEAAFHNLLGVLGYTKENAEIVITTLEELGFILSKPIDIENGITSAFSISDAQAKALSDYQSKIDSISSSLSDLSSLTSSDITSLLIEFKDSAKAMEIFEKYGVNGAAGVGDLNSALKEVAQTMRDDLIAKYPEFTDAINGIFNDALNNPFDSINKEFDTKLAYFEHQANMIEAELARAELQGQMTVKKYYQDMYDNEELRLSDLEAKKERLEQALVDSGLTGGEKFNELQSEINDVALEIELAKNNLLEFQNEMQNIDWDIFDFNREQAQRTMGESDFLIDLLDGQKLVNDMGDFTEAGMSTIGLHGVNFDGYLEEAGRYADELVEIEKQLADDPYNVDKINRYNELLEKQQEMIIAAESEKEAIADLVREGYETQKNALQELIDEYTEALDAEKNLYDQQKKTADQTKRIAELRKMIASVAGDTSEETRAQVQKWQVELDEANSDLESDQYDQYIADQKEILSAIMDEYSEVLDTQAENTEALFAQAMLEAETNVDTIVDAINKVVEAVGYNPQTGLTDLMTGESQSITENVVQIDPEVSTNLKNTEINTDETSDNTKTTADNVEGVGEKLGEATEQEKVFKKDLIASSNANTGTLNKGHGDLNRQMIMLNGETDECIVTSNGITLKKLGNVQTNMDASFVKTNNAIASIPSSVSELAAKYLQQTMYNAKSIGTTTVGDINVAINTQAKDAKQMLLELQKNDKFKAVIVDTVSESLGGGSALAKYRH